MKRLSTRFFFPLALFSLATAGHATLIEEYPFNEGATNPSATTVSSITSANTGTLVNGPVWTTTNLPPIPGGTGAYLYFNAATPTPYIQTTSSGVTGGAARTVAFWLLAPAGLQPQNAGLCSWGVNSTGQRFTLRLDPGTSGGVLAALRLEDQGAFATAKTPLTDGKWHHVAVVYSGTGGPNSCVFYVDGNNDGQSAGSSNIVNTTVNANASSHLGMGTVLSISAGAGYGFNGGMSDFRMYDTALTQSAILQLVYGAGNPPVVTQSPTNQSPVLGDTNATATFNVSVTGSGISYFWRRNGAILGAPNGSTLVVGPNLSDANIGAYDVIVSNAWGFTNSAPALLRWGTPPVDPAHQGAVSGGSATFSVNGLPASQSYAFQWQEAGTNIPNATNAPYTKTGLTAADSTNYSLVLTLGADSATSAVVAVTVVGTASPYAAIVLGDNPLAYWRLDEAGGASVALDQCRFDNGAYVNYNGSELGGAGALLNDPDASSTFNASGENNYVEVPFDAVLARTNSITLEAWVNPTSANTGVYQSIIGSHTKNATKGVELGINGTAWDFRTGNSTDSSMQVFDDLNAGTASPGQWTHLVGTYDGAVKRLYVNGLLAAADTTNILASSTLWRIGADFTYQSTAGQFFTGSIDEPAIYGKALSPAQVVNHYDLGIYGSGTPPTILSAPQNQQVIFGSINTTVTFTVTAGGSPPFYYQWAFGTTNISGATGPSLTITNAGATNLGTYSVIISNGVSPAASAMATLSVAPIPALPRDQAGLAGNPATFTVSLSTNVNYNYQWRFNGSPISGATGSALQLAAVTAANGGTYDALVSFGTNAKVSDPATLEILTSPSSANAYATAITGDSPADWWRLDDAPGSPLANDLIGNNPGSVYSDVTLGVEGAALGDPDTAAYFTGYNLGTRVGNSRIQVANTSAVNAHIFTVELWALANGGAGTARSPLTSRDTTSGTAGYCLYAGSDDHWQFWLGNGSAAWTVLEGPPVVLGQWVHLAGIYDGANGVFYVNGGLAGQTNTTYVPNQNFNMNIGAGGSETINGSDYFPGRIDEVAVYDAALSRTQVQTHFAAAFPSSAAPRVTVQPLSRAALAGQTYQFYIATQSPAPLACQWQFNSNNIPGATNTIFTLSNLTVANTGAYQAIVTHGTNTGSSLPATLTVVNGEAVSINLEGNEPNFTVNAYSGYAGYVRATNWNEFGYHANSGSASNLVNNIGLANSMVVTWSFANNHRWGGPVRLPQGDFAMMSGFFSDNAGTVPGTVTISGIPASYQQAGYSLYVYMSGPAATAGAVTGSSYFGAVSVGAQTNYYHAVDLALWDGSFLQATNVNALDSAPATANYAVFSGLTGSSATITVAEAPAGVGPSTISGFQVVANVASVPSPVPLYIAQQGANVTITWTGNNGILQQTSDLTGKRVPWTDVAGAANPYHFTVSNGNLFFRLRSP